MNNIMNKEGVGMEVEGLIINNEGKPIETIGGLPSSQVTKELIMASHPVLDDQIGFEQASVMLEVKSQVCATEELAIEEIMQIRAIIDRVLEPHGLRLRFMPVAERGFVFIPATTDPNSRTHQLVERWGKTAEGRQNLFSTATASLQVNDSRVFNGGDHLEEGKELFNRFIAARKELLSLNGTRRSFMGKTRLEHAQSLLCDVKAEQFRRHGFASPLEIIFPSHFKTVRDMQKWMQAHSDVTQFADADCKEEHSFLCKIKRGNGPWVLESRFADAVDDDHSMLQIVRQIAGLTKSITH